MSGPTCKVLLNAASRSARDIVAHFVIGAALPSPRATLGAATAAAAAVMKVRRWRVSIVGLPVPEAASRDPSSVLGAPWVRGLRGHFLPEQPERVTSAVSRRHPLP